MNDKLSLVIVEDNELMLFGISSALSKFSEIEIVGTAGDGKKGLAVIEQAEPKVALIDIRMPKMNGIELTKAIREKNIKTSIVIITSIEDDEWLFKAFLAGANAYTLKDIQPDELFNTIKMVSSGLTLIQPTVAKHVLQELQTVKKTKETTTTTTEPLTERELETLTLIAKGYKNKQIADAMFITEGTVKLHVNNILRKLGVTDRTQALLKAIENDLL
jgi:DNA-binding NarL/FixJ family response regulator